MKRKIFTLAVALGLGGLVVAQPQGQNPRAREAYQVYENQVDGLHSASMGATIDKTYVAYDPLLMKQQRREERREFRRQLKLERARNRRFYFGYPYGHYWYW